MFSNGLEYTVASGPFSKNVDLSTEALYSVQLSHKNADGKNLLTY